MQTVFGIVFMGARLFAADSDGLRARVAKAQLRDIERVERRLNVRLEGIPHHGHLRSGLPHL